MITSTSTLDMFLALLKMSGAVLGILGLAYLILNKGVGKLMGRPSHQGNVKVLDKCMLDQRNALYVIEVGSKQMLVASGQNGSNLIAKLDEPVVTEAKASASAEPLPLFSNWLAQKKNPKPLPQ